MRRLLVLALLCLAPGALAQTTLPSAPVSGQTGLLGATSNTYGMPALWVHPTDVTRSLIFGVDGQSGLLSFNLAGAAVPQAADGGFTAVDVRYGFKLGAGFQDIVGVGATDGTLRFYSINASTLGVTDVTGTVPSFGTSPVGCLSFYQTGAGTYDLFVATGSNLHHLTVVDNGAGKLDAVENILPISPSGMINGCKSDEPTGSLYFTVPTQGLDRGIVSPDGGFASLPIDTVGSNPNLGASVNGVTLYPFSNGGGYLIIASPGASGGGNTVFSVYQRNPPNGRVSAFQLVAGDAGISSVRSTAGLTLTDFPLGTGWPSGLFVAHSQADAGTTFNFKLASWGDIASAAGLTVDTGVDPRASGTSPADGGTDGGSLGGGGTPSGGYGGGGGTPLPASRCGCGAGPVDAWALAMLGLGALILRRRPARRAAKRVEG